MTKSYLWELLSRAEQQLPALVADSSRWHSVYVNYEKPYVERLWTELDADHRLFLHVVEPCAEGESLYHPHPWPSIVKVLPGAGYEHGVGYDLTGSGAPPVGMVQTFSGGVTYEMSDPRTWHYVRPLTSASLSIMITGRPFVDPPVGYRRPAGLLSPLSEQRRMSLLHMWGMVLRESSPPDPSLYFLSSLKESLDDEEVEVGAPHRGEGILLLLLLSDFTKTQDSLRALYSKEPYFRRDIVRLLGRMPVSLDPRLVPFVAEGLSSPHPSVRQATIWALSNYHTADALASLAKHVEIEDSPWLLTLCENALGRDS